MPRTTVRAMPADAPAPAEAPRADAARTGAAPTGERLAGETLAGAGQDSADRAGATRPGPAAAAAAPDRPGADVAAVDVAAADAAALAVVGVSHSYGARQALRNVSLSVPAGSFTALLGLNGAGKTTLFALVTRLYDTRSGHISVLGHRVDRTPGEALRRLGVVFQARTLDGDLSVLDNLLYHASLHGIGGRQARARSLAVLAEVDMAGRARDKARALSGGQMRRVEIARALLHDPRLLVLDEPTVGLDVASKATILSGVRRLVRERGVAVLWATHLLDEIEPQDRVVVLHKGAVLAEGPMAEVVAGQGAADLRSAFAALTGGES